MRRVYKEAKAVAMAGGHGVALDGGLIKTPGRRDLLMPSGALATAIAEEWDVQHDEVRPTKMPLTRLAATCIDRVALDRGAIIRQTANYAGTDLVCYRAMRP